MNIYKFVPKKKYAQVLKETDSEPSDATEIEDESEDDSVSALTESNSVEMEASDEELSSQIEKLVVVEQPVPQLLGVVEGPVLQYLVDTASVKVNCPHCLKPYSKGGVQRHIFYCYKKPILDKDSESD